MRLLGVKPRRLHDAGRATSPARTRQLTSRAQKRGPNAPMSGRHRKPTASAVNVAKIAFTGAVIGSGSLALAGQAGAATDGEWDQVAKLRIRRQLGHQHRQRLPGRTAVLAEHLVVPRRRRVRARRAHGHQGRADRGRRARARQPGQGRVAGLRRALSGSTPRNVVDEPQALDAPGVNGELPPPPPFDPFAPPPPPEPRRSTRCRPRCPTHRARCTGADRRRRARGAAARCAAAASCPAGRGSTDRRRRARRAAAASAARRRPADRRHDRRARRQLGRRSRHPPISQKCGPCTPQCRSTPYCRRSRPPHRLPRRRPRRGPSRHPRRTRWPRSTRVNIPARPSTRPTRR